MWLIGKTVNWANWDPAGRSCGSPVCGEQSFGFCISSVPHPRRLRCRSAMPIRVRRIRMRNRFSEPRPRKLAPDLGAEPAALFGRSTPGAKSSKRHSDELMPSRRAGFAASTPSFHGFASAESVGRRSAHRAPPPPPGRVCGPCEQPPPGLPPDPGSSGWH